MKLNIAMLFMLVFTSCGYTQKPTDMQSGTSTRNNDTGNYPLSRSNEEWKETLDHHQYQVLREAGTERPFTGKYYKTMDAGIYYSAATGQPLFASDAKYDSSCGWPSFFEPITESAILYRKDTAHGMVRTEIIDSSSGSHLGHVFDDGPPPTGLRYCMNSASMIFVGINENPPILVQDYMVNHANDEEKEAVRKFLEEMK